MFLENVLLVCLWLVGIWPDRGDNWMLAPVTVVASFAIGILFMVTYYRWVSLSILPPVAYVLY